MRKEKTAASLSAAAKPAGRGAINAFKSWRPEDLKELSLERDLQATARLCEILGLCSVEQAQGFRQSFEQIAGLGYAGYCYYNFASVSMQGLLDVYAALIKEQLGPDFKAVYIWNWTSQFLNAREPNSRGGVRMTFKNAAEPEEMDMLFTRFMRFDDKYGVEKGETTKVQFTKDMKAHVEATHPGFTGLAIPCKDFVTLAIMDQIDLLNPQPRFAKLGRRALLAHAFTEVAAGRWLPGARVGHLWLNTNRSIGMEGISGLENERWIIAFGAAWASSANEETK